jgi:hypothetical protein
MARSSSNNKGRHGGVPQTPLSGDDQNWPPEMQITDEIVLGLLHSHQIVSESMGWREGSDNPFNAGVRVSPLHSFVKHIPPCTGKLGFLALKGGAVFGTRTLEDMATKDYLLLDSSQLGTTQACPSGHLYVSFQPGQVPGARTDLPAEFCFMLRMGGTDLPPLIELSWRTPCEPVWARLGLIDIATGLYCGLIYWTAGLIEISGAILQPMEFHWAQLRRLHVTDDKQTAPSDHNTEDDRCG